MRLEKRKDQGSFSDFLILPLVLVFFKRERENSEIRVLGIVKHRKNYRVYSAWKNSALSRDGRKIAENSDDLIKEV